MIRLSQRASKWIRLSVYSVLATIIAFFGSFIIGKQHSKDSTLTTDLDEYMNSNIVRADSPHWTNSGDDDADGDDSPDDGDNGCFAKGTPVDMADGTKKPIEELVLGDKTMGGVVTGLMQFRLKQGEFYQYKGIRVAGCHPVNDDGTWRYVSDSAHAVQLEDPEDRTVYLVNTTEHRVFVNGIEFSDYIEIDANEPIKAFYLKHLMQHHQDKTDIANGKPILSRFSAFVRNVIS